MFQVDPDKKWFFGARPSPETPQPVEKCILILFFWSIEQLSRAGKQYLRAASTTGKKC